MARPPIPKEKRQEVIAEIRSGTSVSDAAIKTGVSRGTVGNVIKTMPKDDRKCGCGRPLRHPGNCSFAVKNRMVTAPPAPQIREEKEKKKDCIKCGISKILDDFPLSTKCSIDGHENVCKECKSKRRRDRLEKADAIVKKPFEELAREELERINTGIVEFEKQLQILTEKRKVLSGYLQITGQELRAE